MQDLTTDNLESSSLVAGSTKLISMSKNLISPFRPNTVLVYPYSLYYKIVLPLRTFLMIDISNAKTSSSLCPRAAIAKSLIVIDGSIGQSFSLTFTDAGSILSNYATSEI